jgi:hypothetical protein
MAASFGGRLAAIHFSVSIISSYESDSQMQNWLHCIKSRRQCVADVKIGRCMATMCLTSIMRAFALLRGGSH